MLSYKFNITKMSQQTNIIVSPEVARAIPEPTIASPDGSITHEFVPIRDTVVNLPIYLGGEQFCLKAVDCNRSQERVILYLLKSPDNKLQQTQFDSKKTELSLKKLFSSMTINMEYFPEYEVYSTKSVLDAMHPLVQKLDKKLKDNGDMSDDQYSFLDRFDKVVELLETSQDKRFDGLPPVEGALDPSELKLKRLAEKRAERSRYFGALGISQTARDAAKADAAKSAEVADKIVLNMSREEPAKPELTKEEQELEDQRLAEELARAEDLKERRIKEHYESKEYQQILDALATSEIKSKQMLAEILRGKIPEINHHKSAIDALDALADRYLYMFEGQKIDPVVLEKVKIRCRKVLDGHGYIDDFVANGGAYSTALAARRFGKINRPVRFNQGDKQGEVTSHRHSLTTPEAKVSEEVF